MPFPSTNLIPKRVDHATSDPPKICTAEDQKKKDDEDLSAEDLALKQQLELYVERVQGSDPGLQKVGLESMSMNLAGEIAQEYGKRQSEEAAIEDLLELVQ
ncbi:hypothetical protein GOBAR_AA02052 [Gossypium barbadense]|uniref:RPN1 N-terminal domain-containing protein n=1 Tax=Gossypium barbadense TaxID=3634 RepID=A0A2P5YSF7_GOSBA|nr:hypothetical protein GOBAR_AA02052 [Gossypium barbadense]